LIMKTIQKAPKLLPRMGTNLLSWNISTKLDHCLTFKANVFVIQCVQRNVLFFYGARLLYFWLQGGSRVLGY
jgi:hypothetical protein